MREKLFSEFFEFFEAVDEFVEVVEKEDYVSDFDGVACGCGVIISDLVAVAVGVEIEFDYVFGGFNEWGVLFEFLGF